MTVLSDRHFLIFLICLAVTAASGAQVISTVAGGGYNNVPATSADLAGLSRIATDSSGNIFFPSGFPSGNQIYKVSPSSSISLFAGNGAQGNQFSGEGGPAANAAFSNIEAVAVDENDNVYVGDGGLDTVWKIDAITGRISTLALLPNSPTSMAVDRSGNVFVSIQ